ncbi:MAG: hypothetical protein ACR2OC_11410 [Solirubrobacterales bacterium]
MSNLTPQQAIWRERFEGLIGLAAPALDLLLAAGERVSRIAEPDDHEYYPVRSGSEASLPGEFSGDATVTRGGDD